MSENAVLAERYRLDSRIAAGGVGEVWRAEDTVLGRPVAVKRLRAEYAEHPETLARFRSEARHAAALSHPGIAQVYDYGESGMPDQPFLVMELVDGPSLADILSRGPLAPERVMDIVAQAAAGLAAAHRAGLVHRDIKPANLLIAPGGQVKITDFGIAHAAGSAPLTRQGSLIGTPAYLAPERVTGHRATPASDLYSLGIVAHECLAGARPYAGTPIETALAHGLRDLPPLPPSVPPAVAAFVAELAAKDPAARPATAGAAAARAAQLRDMLVATPRPAATAAGAAVAIPSAASQGSWAMTAGAGNGPGRAGNGAGQERNGAGAGWAAGAGPARPIGHPATLAEANPLTLPDLRPGHQPPRPGGHGRPAPRRARLPWSGRLVAAAIIASSVAAGLIGWLVSGALGGPAAATSPSAASSPGHQATGTVTVRASALVGLPASTVVRQLRSLGLRPEIRFVRPNDHSQVPGTVAYVRPAGRVQAGSPVVVGVVAGHDHGHGNDHGNGQGNGGRGD